MTTLSFAAMGTTVEAWGVGSGAPLRRWFVDCEDRFSRFRPDSELSAINARGEGSHAVSTDMLDVLVAAERVRALTDGLVDVGVGAAVRAWGYRESFEQVVDLDAEPSLPTKGSWGLKGESLHVEGRVSLDLGGVVKGWACDRAVERGLAEMVSAGGDIASASEDAIASIADPWDEPVATVHLGKGALATSSVSRRSWRVGTRRANHLIDPRTMSPVESPVISASVVASTAVEAEAGAKAVLIHGADGLDWAAGQGWVRAAMVVWRDGTVYGTAGTEWMA